MLDYWHSNGAANLEICLLCVATYCSLPDLVASPCPDLDCFGVFALFDQAPSASKVHFVLEL
jgi:hypothetical protein